MVGNGDNGEERPFVDAAGGANAAELALDTGDESLPWLESDDDYEDQGIDTGRIAAFALIGLLAIGLVVGGIWWATRDDGASRVADGSTIEAPEGPYKAKPENPGGKTFAGTGDTSFAVAEGQTREGRIDSKIVKPSIDLAGGAEAGKGSPENPSENVGAKAAQEKAPPPPEIAGVGVQVGAYSNRASAEQGWSTLAGRYSALQGVKHRVVEGRADIGTVYRLQAVAPNLAAANSLCAALKAAGGTCQVKP